MTNDYSNNKVENKDIYASIEISQDEAVAGATKFLVIKNVKLQKPLKVTIPKGVTDGTQLQFKGVGRKDEAGKNGDLYLTVKIKGIAINNNQKQYEFKATSTGSDAFGENDSAINHYKQGIKYFSQNNMQKALAEFKKASENEPENEEYQIMVELTQYKINPKDEKSFYEDGLKCLKKEKFIEAVELFEKALCIKEDDLYKEALQVAKSKKINVMQVSENILLIVFDKERVKRILKEREKGKIWYNIDSFAGDFNIQPHELIEIQDKIVFPAKKIGRRVRTVER